MMSSRILPASAPGTGQDGHRIAAHDQASQAARNAAGLCRALARIAPVRWPFEIDSPSAAQATARIAALEAENARLAELLAELKKRESSVRYLAYHDGLTGLANRRLLLDRFQQAVAQADRQDKHVALLLFDLDGFKRINDTLGHLAGDQILQSVAARLVDMTRRAGTVSRYGGDEFIVMLPGFGASDVDIAGRIRERLGNRFRIDGIDIHLSASVGTALYPRDGRGWNVLMRHADARMYSAKASPRCYCGPVLQVRDETVTCANPGRQPPDRGQGVGQTRKGNSVSLNAACDASPVVSRAG